MKDPAGFAEFVSIRSASLTRFAYLVTGDRHLAEDLLQGALMKLAQRWSRVDDPLAYAKRVMVNENISWWRRRRIREHPVDEVVDKPAGEDTAESVVRREVFVRALRRLTTKQRTVLVLRYYEDMSEAATADAMGCSVGTVKSQTHYALEKLRELAPELTMLDDRTAMEAL